VDDPRAWLSEVALKEGWNEATLPRITSALDELGIEVERRGESVCIRDDRYCEPATPGQMTVALDRLLDDEKQRRKRKKKQDAKARRAKQELKDWDVKRPPRQR
jgi:hypothetical protein